MNINNPHPASTQQAISYASVSSVVVCGPHLLVTFSAPAEGEVELSFSIADEVAATQLAGLFDRLAAQSALVDLYPSGNGVRICPAGSDTELVTVG